MKFKEIAFVSYAINDVARSRAFYEGIRGLKPSSIWEGDTSAFIEYEIGNNTLAIGKGAEKFKPGKNGGTVALEVDDFDEAVSTFKKNKVKFLMDPYESPVCHMVLIEDPDGNQIMVHRRR